MYILRFHTRNVGRTSTFKLTGLSRLFHVICDQTLGNPTKDGTRMIPLLMMGREGGREGSNIIELLGIIVLVCLVQG